MQTHISSTEKKENSDSNMDQVLSVVATDKDNEDDVDGKNNELRRLVSKMDIRILPLLSLCYLLTVIDRSNIGTTVTYIPKASFLNTIILKNNL